MKLTSRNATTAHFMKFLRFRLRTIAAALLCLLILSSFGQIAAVGQTTDIGQTVDDRLPDGRKSDGCTLIGGDEFKACCVAHDRDYFYGGTVKERRASDKRLFECINGKKSFGAKLAAPFIWLGVRIGGLSFLPTSFRWGFGKKFKKPASATEEPKATES